MSDLMEEFELLFERPTEPVVFPKGRDNVVFEVPSHFLGRRDKNISDYFNNDINLLSSDELPEPMATDDPAGDVPASARPSRPLRRMGSVLGTRTLKVERVPLPDFSHLQALPREASFSLFVPWHRQLAAQLIEIFMGVESSKKLVPVALSALGVVNAELVIYALSVALLHRGDTTHVQVPPLGTVFPHQFVPAGTLGRCYKDAATPLLARAEQAVTVPSAWRKAGVPPEQRLGYFREDLGVNLHHWHWHLVYPTSPRLPALADKDRRGELFYYMHQQILARYNLERFSVGLDRVQSLKSLRDPLEDGYYPKLDARLGGRSYAGRPDRTAPTDVLRETDQTKVVIDDLERWYARILSAVHSGVYIDKDGQRQNLDEETGIDLLGNMMEANIMSPNKGYYGDFHNSAHNALACCHDPVGKHDEELQVMSNPATAMRDPVFYSLHALVDGIFREYKESLAPYAASRLREDGLRVRGVWVRSRRGSAWGEPPRGELLTFWQHSDVDLSGGLDFMQRDVATRRRDPVYARFLHLQHAPFKYTFRVENESGKRRMVTVRVFLGPLTDGSGKQLTFDQQRTLFVELDKFTKELDVGEQDLERESSESSVTIPFEDTFRKRGRPVAEEEEAENVMYGFCGCGWPQHMLLPRGNADGVRMALFVMLTDFDKDKVEGAVEKKCCKKEAVSFCGVRDSKYPDRQPMGFPFDRRARDGVGSLEDFVRGVPNMDFSDVTIRHVDDILLRREGDDVVSSKREPDEPDSGDWKPVVPEPGVPEPGRPTPGAPEPGAPEPGRPVANLLWVIAGGGQLPPDAVVGGKDAEDGKPLYVGRLEHHGALLPGKVKPEHGRCYAAFNGAEISKDTYQVLCGRGAAWAPARGGVVPPGAVPAGEAPGGETLFAGRARHCGSLTPGKVHPSHGTCYIPFGGQEIGKAEYEVLVAL